jgi:putative transposase
VAPHRKKAEEEGAHLVLIDESGFFLNPLVRRTWAPKGETPTLRAWGRHRDKVSVVAAISLSPRRRQPGLYFQADSKHYITAETVVKFLRAVLRRLRGRVIVVWDGGSSHKGPLIRELLSRYPRLHLERLPSYAPELNPVEQLWSYLKHGRLANFVPRNLWHLDHVVHEHLLAAQKATGLLKKLWKGSNLPLPHPALLS